MRNIEKWQPSKWTLDENNRLHCSEDPKEVGCSSWLCAQIVGDAYTENIPKYAKGKLLDIGCGKIPLYILYSRYIDDVMAIDWENTLHKNDNVDFFCDITKPLPSEDNYEQ